MFSFVFRTVLFTHFYNSSLSGLTSPAGFRWLAINPEARITWDASSKGEANSSRPANAFVKPLQVERSCEALRSVLGFKVLDQKSNDWQNHWQKNHFQILFTSFILFFHVYIRHKLYNFAIFFLMFYHAVSVFRAPLSVCVVCCLVHLV